MFWEFLLFSGLYRFFSIPLFHPASTFPSHFSIPLLLFHPTFQSRCPTYTNTYSFARYNSEKRSPEPGVEPLTFQFKTQRLSQLSYWGWIQPSKKRNSQNMQKSTNPLFFLHSSMYELTRVCIYLTSFGIHIPLVSSYILSWSEKREYGTISIFSF